MLRAAFLLASAIAALLAPVSVSSAAAGSCDQSIAPAPPGLPASVVLTTTCGEYEIDGTGAVRFLGRPQPPVPAGSDWFPGDLTWYRFDKTRFKGHLLIGRGQKLLWRSRHVFSGRYVDEIAVSADRVAFSLTKGRRTTLYVAAIRGFERAVAHGESPLTWTTTDRLLTTPTWGGSIRLRGPRGRLLRTVAAATAVVDRASHRLYFVAHGTLSVIERSSVRHLSRLARFRLGRRPLLSPLGDEIAISDSRRLVALRNDGSLVSSSDLPRPRSRADWAPGGIAAAPDGAIAFTATSGNTAYGSEGTDTVYLLRPGATAALPLYSQQVEFAICERMSNLSWRGNWLLYSASEGYAAAIDAEGHGASIDLSPLARRLPGVISGEDGIFGADWFSSS